MDRPSYSSYAEFYRNSVYSGFPQEHRSAGSFGTTLIHADQGPHEFVDPPVPELVVQLVRKTPELAYYNLGDGWIKNAIGAGSILVSPPDTEVAYRCPSDHQLLMLTFPKERLFTALQDGLGPLEALLDRLAAQPLIDPTIFAIGHRIWSEAACHEEASALFIDSAALALLALLCRAGGERLPDRHMEHRCARIVTRVRDYVEAHISENIALSDLAGAACLSPYHFARTFKSATGQSPLAYVMERRVERAKVLLATDTMPLAQIAYACGFANQAHFTTVFRKLTGATPLTYRRSFG